MLGQSKPIAVLISDIHFTVNTLELSSRALHQARVKAHTLDIPLVLCGDTLDGKALMRGECVNALLSILGHEKSRPPETYILVGNHDLINEKGKAHSLEFLRKCCTVIDEPTGIDSLNYVLIPYINSTEEMKSILDSLDKNSNKIICHQGVQSAFMGEYVQDKTSLPKDCFRDFRVISGHYHRHQNIKCGPPRKGAVGLFSYVGTPYTTSFSEAEDGPKGFCILKDDGTLELVPTKLRKHVIIDRDIKDLSACIDNVHTHDLIWLKIRGPSLELAKLKKKEVGLNLFGHSNFKFDKIPTDSNKIETKNEQLTNEELLDKLIENTEETEKDKKYLKELWREAV